MAKKGKKNETAKAMMNPYSMLAMVANVGIMQATKTAIATSKHDEVIFLEGFPISASRKNDGVAFKNTYNGNRWFISDSGKWKGMIGVSGKMRAFLETACGNIDWQWKRQGTKNYYYTFHLDTVINTLVKE